MPPREHARTRRPAEAQELSLPRWGGKLAMKCLLDDGRQHAANENQRLQNLWDGIETYAAMLAELRW